MAGVDSFCLRVQPLKPLWVSTVSGKIACSKVNSKINHALSCKQKQCSQGDVLGAVAVAAPPLYSCRSRCEKRAACRGPFHRGVVFWGFRVGPVPGWRAVSLKGACSQRAQHSRLAGHFEPFFAAGSLPCSGSKMGPALQRTGTTAAQEETGLDWRQLSTSFRREFRAFGRGGGRGVRF